MTPEQATELLQLVRDHLSWTGVWEGFAIGIVFSLGLAIFRSARRSVDEMEE
ncbi:MAG: hypothetical protein WC378_11415 [Opitutaceae bacterium]|jgi:hypothetical protein